MVRIGQPAVPSLIEALGDEDWDVRREAAWALGEIGDARAVPSLIEALRDEDWRVREAAVEALEGIGAPALPELERTWQGKSVVDAAREAIERIKRWEKEKG